MMRAVLAALALMVGSAPAVAQDTPADQASSPDQATSHVVKPGETLGGIANRAGVARVLIAEANGLEPPYVLRAGQTLVIPRTRRHTVAAGETGFAIGWKYGVRWSEIAVANNISPDARLRTGQTLLIPTVLPPATGTAAKPAPATRPAPAARPSPAPTPTASAAPAPSSRFAWPLAGKARRGFTARGQSNYHDGIDIPAPAGTAVRATAAGKVIYAGEEPQQFGNLVIVDHGGGWTSAYAFLSRITVKQGDPVKKGERVGLVGDTGMARGTELHFEMRRDNRPVDPGEHLPAQP